MLDGLDRCPRTPPGAAVNASGCAQGQAPNQARAVGCASARRAGGRRGGPDPGGAARRRLAAERGAASPQRAAARPPIDTTGRPLQHPNVTVPKAGGPGDRVGRDSRTSPSPRARHGFRRRPTSPSTRWPRSCSARTPTSRVEIGAHTDNSGSTSDDNRASRQLQAEAVRDYLVVKGVQLPADRGARLRLVGAAHRPTPPRADAPPTAAWRFGQRHPAPDLRGTMEERAGSLLHHLLPQSSGPDAPLSSRRCSGGLSCTLHRLSAQQAPSWGDELPPAPPLPDSLFAIPQSSSTSRQPAPPLLRPPSPGARDLRQRLGVRRPAVLRSRPARRPDRDQRLRRGREGRHRLPDLPLGRADRRSRSAPTRSSARATCASGSG